MVCFGSQLILSLVIVCSIIGSTEEAHKRYDHIYLDTYERQLPNNVLLLEMSVTPKQHEDLPKSGIKMENPICLWIIDTLHRFYNRDIFYQGQCRLAANRTREQRIDLDFIFVLPLPIYDSQRFYGNPDDLLYTINQAILGTNTTATVPGKVHLLDVSFLRLGKAHSNFVLLGSPTKKSKLDQRNRTSVELFVRKACYESLTILVDGNSKLRDGLRGCWTSIKIENNKEVTVGQKIYFEWLPLYLNGAFANKKQFIELVKAALNDSVIKYADSVFDVTDCEIGGVLAKVDVLFRGFLTKKKKLVPYNDTYRMLGKGRLLVTEWEIAGQISDRLRNGEKSLTSALDNVDLTGIRPHDNDSMVEGRVWINQTELSSMGINLDDLPKMLQEAYKKAKRPSETVLTNVTFFAYQQYLPTPRFGPLSTYPYSNFPTLEIQNAHSTSPVSPISQSGSVTSRKRIKSEKKNLKIKRQITIKQTSFQSASHRSTTKRNSLE